MLKIIKENDEQKVLKCPACSSGEIIIDKNSKYLYGYCDTCGAAYIDYEPLPHQLDVHKSKARFKLLMGG